MSRIFIAAIIAAFGLSASAEEKAATTTPPPEAKTAKKEQGSGPNPYTECGIGAAIFSSTSWAAATSNVIWDLGLTAITSALSSPETCNAKKVKTAKLILETLPQMEKDIATGGGEYLNALGETMDCPVLVRGAVNSQIRTAYAEVVRRDGYASKTKIERAGDLYGSVREAALAVQGACNVTL